VRTTLAGQTVLLGLGLDLGQGIGDWVDDGGVVKPEPVVGHRRKLGERGDRGLLRGYDAGAHPGATVA
jgi:hypothetical protein